MTGVAPYRQTYWDWRAAGNFIFGGTGSGLLIISPLVAADGGPERLFVLVGLGFIAAGLGLVWLEIGKRLRAMNVFLHPHMSWMTRESYAAIGAFLSGFAAIVWGGVVICLIAAVFACLFLYCQARILKASKGIPAWREPALMPVIGATGVAEGLAAGLILALVFAGLPDGINPVRALDFLSRGEPFSGSAMRLAVSALSLVCLLREVLWRRYKTRFEQAAPAEAVKVYDRLQPYFLAANVAPSLFLALIVLAPVAGNLFLLLACFAGLAGGWSFKFSLITRACYTQGFAIPRRPARGPRGSGGKGVQPGWVEKD
jgi:phenylacetyl-CoA:acceptor oxidoreductase subunit 2